MKTSALYRCVMRCDVLSSLFILKLVLLVVDFITRRRHIYNFAPEVPSSGHIRKYYYAFSGLEPRPPDSMLELSDRATDYATRRHISSHLCPGL